MHSKKRTLTATLAAVMLAGSLAACSSGGSNEGTGSTGTGSKPSSDTNAKSQPKIEVSMFMNDAGLSHPENVDPSDNPFIKIIEDMANVDIKLEVPPYPEFNTKYNLLLSSGKLPDLLHTTVPDPTYKAARDGAFIDLKPYYDKSPIVQKVVTPQMMELAKDPVSGKYWRIPMAYDKGPQGAGIYARYDLIEKFNGGKWPETVEQWMDLLRKIKKEAPKSMPMSARVIGDNVFLYGGGVFFQLYGAYPYEYRIVNGKIIPNVMLPEFKAAVEVYRTLYAEGVFDPEFATTDSTKWWQKWGNDDFNVLFHWNSADQILAGQQGLPAEQKGRKYVFAPPLKTYPSVLADPKYATPGLGLPISSHGLYISSKAKDPDRVWKVIEAFAADQLKEAIFWGKEGDEYTMKDGKKVPIVEKLGHSDRRWVRNLALLFGYTDGQDAQQAIFEAQIEPATFKMIKNSMTVLQKQAEPNGIKSLIGYSEPEEVVKKNAEIMQAINKFTVEAIMGRITMDQFDQERKAWEAKYRAMKYDPMQKWFDANKENLKKLGVKMADW